ncbi:hypothetical protein [Solirubrobacter soli]|nr:hypothetical protein [Solirubrobacter soli]
MEERARAAFEGGDWETLRLLQDSNRLPAPSSIELRDDQVYRWTAT